MNSNRKPIPQFTSEDEEREFWATHDSTEYIDWSKAEKHPSSSPSPPPKRITQSKQNHQGATMTTKPTLVTININNHQNNPHNTK